MASEREFCIIGSGPAAVSAAVALTRRNKAVTMLDAGSTLDAQRRESVVRMGGVSPDEWQPGQVALIKQGVETSAKGIPLKRLFGSDFAFHLPDLIEFDAVNSGIRPSFARGGLSTVWGAGVLPFHGDDIEDWPVEAQDLTEHYRAVLSFMPVASCTDDLAELFPTFVEPQHALRPSSQAQAFLDDAAQAKPGLRRRGILVGRSRLAVDSTAARHGRRVCQYCGVCLYGCPYELIYNSEFTLRELRRLPNFEYQPNFLVQELRETGGDVHVLGYDTMTRQRRQFTAGRVLLGAGVVSTTAIVLRSLNDCATPIRIQDSLYFLMPLIRFKGAKNAAAEPLHTLAQIFVIIRDPSICKLLVHLSVYTYNDLMVPSLKAAGGGLGRFCDSAWRWLGSRTLVCGGYLHSRLSPGILMTLDRGEAGTTRIRLRGEESAASAALVRRIGRKLLKEVFALRAIPLLPAIKASPPGRGFHAGGSFPMRRERVRRTSDVEGRPFGFDRVHLIDASCLPSIPATTITLPVMANAYRIAALAADRGA